MTNNGIFQRKDPYTNGNTTANIVSIVNDGKLSKDGLTSTQTTMPIEATIHSTSSSIIPGMGSINYEYFSTVNQTKYDSSNGKSIVVTRGNSTTNHKEGSNSISNVVDDGDCISLTELESKYLRAINLNSLDTVRYCINQGVNINVKNSFSRYACNYSL